MFVSKEQINIDKNKEIFNKMAPSYDFFLLRFWMKRFHRPVLDEIKFFHGAKILDISFGTGELLGSLRARNRKKCTFYGVDIAKNMIDVAKKKLPKDIILQQADVHHLPFSDDEFDYVVNMEAFHHYHTQKKALEEMARVVKKDGKVIVVDLNFFFPVVHFLFGKLEAGCVKVNDKKELRRLFRKAGLRRIKQKRTFIFTVTTVGTKK